MAESPSRRCRFPVLSPRSSVLPGRGFARASILLEVLVTVTIIALFMALIGGQILTSVKAAGVIERRQTAMMLAESIASRLQAGGFELSDQPTSMADTFETAAPGWGWRLTTEQTDDPSLMRVHLEVLQGDPAQATDTAVDSMTVVTDMYTFWAIPAKMNLAEDFGLSDEDAAALANLGIDPGNFDPQQLAGLDIASLLKQYPQLEALLQMYGIDASMLQTMDPEQIRQALETYMAANGGQMPNLPGMGGGQAGGGEAGGGEGGGGQAGGGENNQNNDNNNGTGGDIDWNELAQLLGSGDKAAAEAYIRAHGGQPGGGQGGGQQGGTGGGNRR